MYVLYAHMYAAWSGLCLHNKNIDKEYRDIGTCIDNTHRLSNRIDIDISIAVVILNIH